MTLEQFKKEKVDAMKNHDKETVSALNVIITKIMSLTIEKRAVNETVSEADIDTLLKKAEKELIEEKEGFEKYTSELMQAKKLSKFLSKIDLNRYNIIAYSGFEYEYLLKMKLVFCQNIDFPPN